MGKDALEGPVESQSSLLPDWVKKIAAVGGGSALVALVVDPRAFILEHVLTFAVEQFLEAGAVVAGAFESVWLIVAEALVDAFDPVFSGGAMIASAIAGLLSTINAVLVDVVAVAGPVAPIIVMLIWAVVAIGVTLLVRWLLKATPYVGQWI